MQFGKAEGRHVRVREHGSEHAYGGNSAWYWGSAWVLSTRLKCTGGEVPALCSPSPCTAPGSELLEMLFTQVYGCYAM